MGGAALGDAQRGLRPRPILPRLLGGHRTSLRGAATGRTPERREPRLHHRLAGATDYLSGPSARDYLDEAQFAQAGIRVGFADYSGYPEYPQVHPPFEHGVSMLDLLFCAGPEAVRYMKRL